MSLSMGAPATALAEPTLVVSRGEAFFNQGREASSRGDYELALASFHLSQGLEPGNGKLLNIALCEERLGRLTTAIEDYRSVLPHLSAEDPRQPVARQHISALDLRIPRLRVDLASGAPDGAAVTCDGARLSPAMLGIEAPVDPGVHVITVGATGTLERQYEVILEEGKHLALLVEPGMSTQPATPTRREAPRPVSSARTGGFIAGGVGIAGLALGGVTGLLALGDHGASESQCPTHRGCSADAVSRAGQGSSLSTASTIAFAAGAVGVGFGVYLLLPSAGSAPSPTIGLTLSPGGARVGIQQTF